MSTAEQTKRLTISPAAREKCIKRARKEVEFLDKWGYWHGIGFVVGGFVFWGIGVGFIVLLQLFAQGFWAPQQAQNFVWQGFIVGILFGFITIGAVFEGLKYIVLGINYLRGNPTSRMLVEYHDALVNLMHEQDGHLSSESDATALQDSLSRSGTNA